MSDSKDVLDGEISLEASIDTTGVKAKAKSRIIAAIDRLIGGIIDIPGAYVEGKARRIRLKNSAQDALLGIDAEAAVERLRTSPDAGSHILRAYIKDQVRKQDNRNAVAYEAVEALKQLPPPSELEFEDTDERPINDDWLNIFSAHAENASSEHLRSLWGRILAGEVRKPGSFSLTTLRAIAEIDKDIAELLQKIVKNRINDYHILKPKELSGNKLMEYQFLEDIGLLNNVLGTLEISFSKALDGYFYYSPVNNYNMMIKIKSHVDVSKINTIGITRTGREIMSILPSPSEIDTLRIIAEHIRDRSETIMLCTVLARYPDGSMRIAEIEKL